MNALVVCVPMVVFSLGTDPLHHWTFASIPLELPFFYNNLSSNFVVYS